MALGADVALDLAEPVDRQVQRAAVVLELHEVVEDPAHLELLEAAIAPDAVLVVDDRVALGDLAEIAQRRRAAGRRRLAVRPRTEDLLLGDQRQPIGGQAEPVGQRARENRQRTVLAGRIFQLGEQLGAAAAPDLGREAPGAQHRRQSIGVRTVGRDQAHALAVADP